MTKKIIKPLNFKVEAKSAIPVYEQVKQAIKLLVISDYLEEGDQIMSIRELGARLKIHPNTIAKVYYQLEVEGFIFSRQGAGYYVKVDRRRIQKEKHKLFEQITKDYINKAMAMGYSSSDMVAGLKEILGETIPNTTIKGE